MEEGRWRGKGRGVRDIGNGKKTGRGIGAQPFEGSGDVGYGGTASSCQGDRSSRRAGGQIRYIKPIQLQKLIEVHVHAHIYNMN